MISASPVAPHSFRRHGLGIAMAVAVIVPILICGPWLPFLDLVAFVGLDNAPANLSYGPLQYTVFQFTYIGHYAIGRLLLSLGISPPAQITVFYLLQALAIVYVIWRVLDWLVTEWWLKALAAALGLAAFWDGLFLWGGPLPFSLAATAGTLATWCALRETSGAPPNALAVPLFAVLSMTFHPFAMPFVLLLAAVRWCFVPARRWQGAGLVAVLLVFGWLIRSESPESVEGNVLAALFANPFPQLLTRFSDLFTWDIKTTRELFGITPALLSGYLAVLGGIHLLGFLASPIVVVLAREQPAIRMIAALNSAVALMYLCAGPAQLLVPQWPQRILAFHSALTFCAGICAPLYLIKRWRPAWLAPRPFSATGTWLTFAGTAGLVVLGQLPVLRLGEKVRDSFVTLRDGMMKSSLVNSFVVVSDVRGITPYYLRSVPFLLASDHQLLARNVTVFTEWHIQARHPTRLVESWLDLGRQSYEVVFTTTPEGSLHADFKTLPRGEIAVPSGLYQGVADSRPNLAQRSFTLGNRLLVLGCARDAAKHYQAALRFAPDYADAHNNLGVALQREGKLMEALEHFDRALKLNPASLDSECNMADILAALGRPGEADQRYQSVLQRQPNHPRALHGRSQLKAPATP